MTIEFKSAGSKMLAVSVPNKNPYEVGLAMKHVKNDCEYEVLGFSDATPEYHEAMKEAGIYHQQPPKPNRFDYDSYGDRENAEYLMAMVRWGKSLLQVSECWILLKIKE